MCYWKSLFFVFQQCSTVFHQLPAFLLFSSSQYFLPRETVHTLCSATLDESINKHTHGMGGVIIVSNSVFKVFPSNRLEGTWSPVYWQLSRSGNKSQRKLANRYVYIALHSLHTVRHDNIHITIRIVNWLTLFARAASPKTWRFDVDELEEPTCMVYAWNALCS